MNRLNRRRFLALGAASTASVVLVACGNEAPTDAEMKPTQIPDVAGAPPTLAPLTSTPSAQQGGGDQAAGEQQNTSSQGGEGGTVQLEAGDVYYDKTELELAPGQTLVMTNAGMLQHDFVIEDWGDKELIPLLESGASGQWQVPMDVEVGSTVTYYCSVPGHRQAGMEGQLTFIEQAAPDGGAPQEPAISNDGAATPTEGGSDVSPGEQVTIVTLDSLSFEPNELQVAPGQQIAVRNDGFLPHDLAVDAWGGVMVDLLNNGETGYFTVPEDAAVGEQFEFYCTVPGHKAQGMVGTFTIVEGGAPAAGGGEQASTPAEGVGTPAAAGAEGTPAAGGDASDPANVTVVANEWSFAPADFEAVPGATITLMNEGTVSHGMAAESLGGTFLGPVRAGGTGQFRLPTDLKPGDTIEYTAVNSSAATLGMAGTITIIEGEVDASASPAASPMASPVVGSTGGVNSVEVSAVDLAFEPTELFIAADTDVKITLTNNGMLQHDFTIEGTDYQTELLNDGESDSITVNLPAGKFTFFCSVPGHREAGMEGQLSVTH